MATHSFYTAFISDKPFPHCYSLLLQSYWGKYSCKKSRHDNVITWKDFPRYWHFVRGIHRSQGQWRAALLPLICAWTNGWANNRHTGDLNRHGAHYNVIVMRRTVGEMDRKREIWWGSSINQSRWSHMMLIKKNTLFWVGHFRGYSCGWIKVARSLFLNN